MNIHARSARSFWRLASLTALLSLTLFAMSCGPGGATVDNLAPVDGGAGADVPDMGANDVAPDADGFSNDADGTGTQSDADAADAPDTTPTPTVSFVVTTSAGDQAAPDLALKLSDDFDTNTPGVQVDIAVTTKNVPNGSSVNLLVGAANPANQNIQNNAAKFAGVTLACVSSKTTITVRVIVAAKAFEATKTYTLDCSATCDVTLTPVAQTCFKDDAALGTPGFQQAFAVSTKGTSCDTASLTIVDTAGTTSTTPQTKLDPTGKATVLATLSPDTTGLFNATAQVTANLTNATNPGAKGSAGPYSYTITTDAPEITVTKPDHTVLTLADDDNGFADDGIDLVIGGTATNLDVTDKDSIEFLVDGVSKGKATPGAGGTFTFSGIKLTESKDYTIAIEATNKCGLTGKFSSTYSAFVSKGSLAILNLKAGDVLLAKDDGAKDTTTIYDTTVQVGVQGLPPGTTVSLFCRPSDGTYGPSPIATALFDDVTVTALALDVTLDVATLGTKVTCEARDDSPLKSKSAEVSFTVALPPPCLTIDDPSASAPPTKETTLAVLYSAVGLDGQQVQASISPTAGGDPVIQVVLPSPVANGQGSGSIVLQVGDPAAPLPDGAYTLSLDATDTLGNLTADQVCSKSKVAFILDTAAPQIQIVAPSKPVLQPGVDPEAVDIDAATPGFQTTAKVAVVGEPINVGIKVCLTVDAFSYGCTSSVVDGASGAASFVVTLNPGQNVIAATATDLAGNVAAPVTQSVTLNVSDPRVIWVDPLGPKTVAGDSLPVKVRVTEPETGNIIEAATLTVTYGGVQKDGLVVTYEGDGVYTINLVDLPATPGLPPTTTLVQVSGTFNGKTGVSAIEAITRKLDFPDVAITSPLSGAVFNLASAACKAGSTNCVTKVTASVVAVEDGSLADLLVTCGTSVKIYHATVASGALTFSNVEFIDQSDCSLEASVVDAAGQKATGPLVLTHTDRVAPKLTQLEYPQGDTLLLSVDANKDAPGLQTTLQLVTSGLEASQAVTVEVYDDGGAKVSAVESLPHGSVSDGASIKVSWGLVTLPDGFKVTLKFFTQDAAGNPATFSKTFAGVFSAAPEVRISSPAIVIDSACGPSAPCSAPGICVLGQCAFGWSKQIPRTLSAVLFGTPVDSKVRVCTDLAGAQGSPCATAGYTEVASALAGQNVAVVDLSGTLVDGLQTLIAEAEPSPGEWVSSLKLISVAGQKRRVLVDSISPTVTKLQAPAGAGTIDGCLSKVSQASADGNSPGGSFTFTVNTSEEGVVTLYANGSPIAGAKKVPTTNAQVDVTVTFPEGPAQLFAVVEDVAGNTSSGDPASGIPVLVESVDTVPPDAAFGAPTKTLITAADKVVPGALDIVVLSADADVEGTECALKDNDVAKGSVKFTGGQAVFLDTVFGVLTDGSHQLTALAADTCGNLRAIQSDAITVDTAKPGVSLIAPTAGASLTDADDADASAGFQIKTRFTTTGATKWKVLLSWGCDDTFASCEDAAIKASGDVTNPGGEEPPAIFTLYFGNTSNFRVTVVTTDAVGNEETATANFKVQISACQVNVAGVAGTGLVNTKACNPSGSDCASASLDLTVSFVGPCGAVDTVKLLKGTTEVGAVAPTGPSAKFTLPLLDNDVFDLVATVHVAADTKGTFTLPVKTDFKAPKVLFKKDVIAGFNTPAAGDKLLLGAASDLDKGKADVQMHARLTSSDTHLPGGRLISVMGTTGGAPFDTKPINLPLPAFYNLTAGDTDLLYLTVPANAKTTVTATAEDAFGNLTTTSFEVATDLVAPDALQLTPLAAADVNSRRPSIKLGFPAAADNGATGDPAASYDVRYSRNPITNDATFDAACKASDLKTTTIPKPGAAGATETIVIEGPDPRDPADPCKFAPLTDNGVSTWAFAVRALDAAGNRSGLVPESVVTSKEPRLHFAKVAGSGAVYGSKTDLNQRVYDVGDVNGDGFADIGVGGNSTPFCVLFGSALTTIPDYTVDADSGPGHKCLPTSIGPVGLVSTSVDLNGDGVQDLVVSTGVDPAPHAVKIFLGVKGGTFSSTPNVTITGFKQAVGTIAGVSLIANVGNFTGDVSDTNLPVQDIVVKTPVNGAQIHDLLYVIPGSKTWTAATNETFDVTSAPAQYNVAVIEEIDEQSNANFGLAVAGGPLLTETGGQGTQYDDLVVSQGSKTQRIFVIRGRALSGNTKIEVSTEGTLGTTEDPLVVRILPDAPTGATNFGYRLNVYDHDNDGKADLIVNHNNFTAPVDAGGVYVFWHDSIDTSVGKAMGLGGLPLQGMTDVYVSPYNHGYYVRVWSNQLISAGNFDDQSGAGSSLDLLFTDPSTKVGGTKLLHIRSALVRPNSGVAYPLYAYDDLAFGDPFTPSATGWGVISARSIGDFNGDGLVDYLVGRNSGGYAVIVY